MNEKFPREETVMTLSAYVSGTNPLCKVDTHNPEKIIHVEIFKVCARNKITIIIIII